MVGANLKAETFSLMDQRSAIEAQMNALIDHLCGPGGPGLAGNLVDSEGFPRSDIDIPAVRSNRHRLAGEGGYLNSRIMLPGKLFFDSLDASIGSIYAILFLLVSTEKELRNDHKNLTNRIDQNLQILHSAKLTPTASSNPRDSATITDSPSQPRANAIMDVEFSAGDAFAVIDEITPGSPAASDGLQLDDLVVKFGSVAKGADLLARLSHEAQFNQGKPVPVAIVRRGSLLTLTVTPRQWHSRGLLGCHFRIM